jgi:acyl transferase domain-containing protein
LQIPTKLRPWPRCEIRRASVNSFGFGGANAHVIIDAYINQPKLTKRDECEYEETYAEQHLFIVSANDREAAKAYARSLASYLREDEKPEQEQAEFLSKLAFTLGERRSILGHRVAYIASSIEELKNLLEHEKPHPIKSFQSPALVYVLTGQGAQWFGMGRELISIYAVFRASLTAAEKCLHRLGASWSLQGESFPHHPTQVH